MSMEEFYTIDAQNEGKKCPLKTPDGKATDHFLIVLGRHSDSFKQAKQEAMREAMTKELTYNEKKKSRIKVIASLVRDWSFPEKCTPTNVIKFLTKAPQIEEAVDTFAGDDTNFVGKK